MKVFWQRILDCHPWYCIYVWTLQRRPQELLQCLAAHLHDSQKRQVVITGPSRSGVWSTYILHSQELYGVLDLIVWVWIMKWWYATCYSLPLTYFRIIPPVFWCVNAENSMVSSYFYCFVCFVCFISVWCVILFLHAHFLSLSVIFKGRCEKVYNNMLFLLFSVLQHVKHVPCSRSGREEVRMIDFWCYNRCWDKNDMFPVLCHSLFVVACRILH